MNLVGGRTILVKGIQCSPAWTMNLRVCAASLRARDCWKIQHPVHIRVLNMASDTILMERAQ